MTLTSGPQIATADDSASIQWTTDVAAGTRVSYGTNPKLLTERAEGEVTAKHQVDLKGLQPGTPYYFSVGTARVQLYTGSFTTTGKGTGAPKTATPPTVTKAPVAKSAAKAAPAPLQPAPPTRATWGNLESLQDHFDRHGGDFKAKSPDDYAAQAWQFLQRAKQEGLPMKWDDSDGGSLRVFDPKTRAFASYDRRGKTRTYFRPNNPDYWNRQPGNLVKANQLKF